MITPVIAGDTVWLKATFKDRSAVLADPTNVWVKIYDENESLMEILSATQTTTGMYEREYLVPMGSTDLIYEFTGELGGYIATGRDTLDRQFRTSPV